MNMFGMMDKMRDLQAKMKEVQEQMKTIQATAESGAGLVKATANGHRKIIKIEIDESLLTKDDREMLCDLVVAAANKALEEAGEKAAEEIKARTQGMLPNIPGFDLNNLSF